MSRECDAGAFCLQKPQCEYRCHLTNAVLEPETRKVKPYPIVLDDIEPVPEVWQRIGSFLFGFAIAVLIVFFAMMFFTGVWMWGLLI